ncbi:MAG: hypothetical protein FRX48_09177 [Lasallia pustulata]|uniref:Heterokaryon incompatibility domain-containing protein n=1 Tax=Lasallia pustulata TaxID=136370 RepID=A0A5M8PCY0_9LECA|nr:MAG: hypothetical protein FRX48_09177 [Lasallia pustulata]
MDHYAPVSNPYRPVRVPYLGGQYDGLNFAGYPSRRNWDIIRLQQGDFQGASRNDAARFLQTWLYFGLLQEVLGMPIAVTDFFRPDGPEEYVVTTAKLPDYLRRWKLQFDQLLPAAREVHNDRAIEGLRNSYYVWRGFVEGERDNGILNPIQPEIELSIQVLATTLEHCLIEVCHVANGNVPFFRLARNPWLTQRMIGDGWCPSVIEQIWNPVHLAVQYYASILGPPARRLDHSTCEAGNRGCNARTVDDAVYVTSHRTGSCDCGFLGANPEDLTRIVRASNIPLISVTWGDSGPSLELIPFHDGMKYTAISHVWSDGLGNPRENALPACQVKEINRLVSALYSNEQVGDDGVSVRPPTLEAEFNPLSLAQKRSRRRPPRTLETEFNFLSMSQKEPSQRQYFWMDTLCVPLRPPKLRKAAIRTMRAVYSNADKILILDADLMQSTANTSYEAIFTRISCSTWIRRLWTLQEAVLAKTRHFQFAERAVDIDTHTLSHTQLTSPHNFSNELLSYTHYHDFEWPALAFPTSSLLYLTKIWSSLPHRSTSKPADEPTCIATLLDLDPGPLLHTPDALRVQKLWSMHVHGVPAAVLFLPGAKLATPGYRWAPASYLLCGRYGVPVAVPGAVTPRGFDVVLPGFTLSRPRHVTREVIACELEGQVFYIRRNMKHGSPSWEDVNVHEMEGLAVILGQPPMEDPRVRTPLVAL